ncbi:sensor histidine kinase [Nocardioides salsibiostraticola]
MISFREGSAVIGNRLLFSDAPDPRGIQAVLLLLISLNTGAYVLAGEQPITSGWWFAGAGVLLLSSVLAFASSRARRHTTITALVPLLDIGGIGLMRIDPAAGAVALLALIPALWLAHSFGRQGAIAGSLAVMALLSMGLITTTDSTGFNISRALLFPVVVIWASLALARSIEHAEEAVEDAEHGQRLLREALAASDRQQRFSSAIMDTVDVGLVLVDERGRILSANDQYHGFFHLSTFPDGWHVYTEDGTTLLTKEARPITRACAGEEFDDLRLWVGKEIEQRRALSVSARSVRDDDGNIIGAALVCKDVTDFMQALKIREDFVASVSHELRTPLTSIHGYVSIMLEDDDLPEISSRHLRVVARNADRLHRLVNDLLHTAQSDRGPIELLRAPTDVTEIVRCSVGVATEFAAKHAVEMTLQAPPYLRIDVDPQRFAQMTDNLLSNAVKYTPPGGCVNVALIACGDQIELSIADTGIGIGETDRERLFTRFFRAKNTAEINIQGIGLGLSIVKQIVDGHGGQIEVESQQGVGSVFRVRLPVSVHNELHTA